MSILSLLPLSAGSLKTKYLFLNVKVKRKNCLVIGRKTHLPQGLKSFFLVRMYCTIPFVSQSDLKSIGLVISSTTQAVTVVEVCARVCVCACVRKSELVKATRH